MPSMIQNSAGPASAVGSSNLTGALNDLLQAEQECVCNFLVHGAACEGASAEIRRLLQEMCAANGKHSQAIGQMIDAAGGDCKPRRPCAEEQYLGYLSLEYLLPKLVEAKGRQIAAYERALPGLAGDERLSRILSEYLQEHRKHLEQLKAVG